MKGSKGFLLCFIFVSSGTRVIAPEVWSIGVWVDKEGGETLLSVLMDWGVWAGGDRTGRTGDASFSTAAECKRSLSVLLSIPGLDEDQISAIRLASSATLASFAIATGRRKNVSCLSVPIGTNPDDRGFGADEI